MSLFSTQKSYQLHTHKFSDSELLLTTNLKHGTVSCPPLFLYPPTTLCTCNLVDIYWPLSTDSSAAIWVSLSCAVVCMSREETLGPVPGVQSHSTTDLARTRRECLVSSGVHSHSHCQGKQANNQCQCISLSSHIFSDSLSQHNNSRNWPTTALPWLLHFRQFYWHHRIWHLSTHSP